MKRIVAILVALALAGVARAGNLGDANVYVSNSSGTALYLYVVGEYTTPAGLPAGTTVASFNVYTTGSGKATLGLFDSSGANVGSVLGSTNEVTASGTGWVSAAPKATITLVAGHSYWLAVSLPASGFLTFAYTPTTSSPTYGASLETYTAGVIPTFTGTNPPTGHRGYSAYLVYSSPAPTGTKQLGSGGMMDGMKPASAMGSGL